MESDKVASHGPDMGFYPTPGAVSKMETRPSLLVRLRDHLDAEAWQTFVGLYAPLVYQYARRRALQDADAADLTQEVMGEVANDIRSFQYQPERGRFRHWLFTIARRRLTRFQMRRARHPVAGLEPGRPEPAGADEPDAEWNEAFNARVLYMALPRIQSHFEMSSWRVFERVWIERRPAAQVADELSISIEAVYKAKSRILRRLEQEVIEIAEHFSWLDLIESS
jgi:RNA polymerase sigma-70 factor (ECF subfamily)